MKKLSSIIFTLLIVALVSCKKEENHAESISKEKILDVRISKLLSDVLAAAPAS